MTKPLARKLKNGMQAILVPQKGTQSITLMVLARVGSRYESKEVNGASHFIEHLMFKGTKKRSDTLSITKELDRYGAEYNAFTSKDLTTYYIKIDASHTRLAVDILSDMLAHSRFDPKEIDRERGVIIEEINMYEDNPRMHIEDLLEQTLFPSNPLGWSIAGPREVIQKISRQELVRYRDAYYIPSRMALVVAGNIPRGIWTLLEKTFGTFHAPSKPKDQPFAPFTVPAKLEKPTALQTKKTEQVQFGLAFHGLPYHDNRLPAASLLATILGGSMSSRLFINVRERHGLCYSIHASHDSYEDTGIFHILVGLKKTKLEQAVRLIWNELTDVTRKPIEAKELKRAKDHLRGKLTLAFEDSAAQAGWYGKQWIFQKKLLTLEERLREVDRVTPKNIQALAKTFFHPERLATALIGPVKQLPRIEQVFKKHP